GTGDQRAHDAALHIGRAAYPARGRVRGSMVGPQRSYIEMNIDSLKELGWREIMQISKPKKELFKPGIYFLIRKDEIVYVGRSSSIARRILQHHAKRRIEFD